MNLIFSRTLKAICTVVVAGLLSACGASSTFDSFKPTRVIGLGDAYNDTNAEVIYSVRGTGTVETVVGQVAALFGSTNLLSRAESGAKISVGSNSLRAQISNFGTFEATDLVVVTAGSQEIREAYGSVYNKAAATAAAEVAAEALVEQVKELLRLGARHILIVQPLEFSVTPLAYSNRALYPYDVEASPTVTFNNKVSGDLQKYMSNNGYINNPVIYGGWGLSSTFNTLVVNARLGSTQIFANLTEPVCTSVTDVVGCDGFTTDSNYLFADGTNLTPSGNRWVAQYLFTATLQGWR
jgi:hypothetical protein